MSEAYRPTRNMHPDAWDLDKLYAALCAYAGRECSMDLDTVMSTSFTGIECLVGLSRTLGMSREDVRALVDLAWESFERKELGHSLF